MKKLWEVKKVVIEYMEVKAETRQEAKEIADDPHTVELRSVTAKRVNTCPIKNGRSIF
jgi:hypothetical protein